MTRPRIADAADNVFCGICPIRGGAGIQNKILNYFALGIPCVSSEIGTTGIDARPEQDFLTYRTTTEAVEQIVHLFQNESRRSEIAERGRTFVEEKYD